MKTPQGDSGDNRVFGPHFSWSAIEWLLRRWLSFLRAVLSRHRRSRATEWNALNLQRWIAYAFKTTALSSRT